MKKFYHQQRKGMLWQAIPAASILSLFIAIVPRVLFYDFPTSWTDELTYFSKMYAISLVVVAAAIAGPAMLYRSILFVRYKAQAVRH